MKAIIIAVSLLVAPNVYANVNCNQVGSHISCQGQNSSGPNVAGNAAVGAQNAGNPFSGLISAMETRQDYEYTQRSRYDNCLQQCVFVKELPLAECKSICYEIIYK